MINLYILLGINSGETGVKFQLKPILGKGASMIYNCVTMIIKKGKMEEFLAECCKVHPLVLAEQGCVMYDYTHEIETGSDRQEPIHQNRITLYEKWESIEAHDIHSGTQHMIEFVSRVASMRESVIIRTGTEAF